MLQSLIKFFVSLGLSATLAATVVGTVYSYYQQYGTFDGSGWTIPDSVSGVPEISARHWTGLGILLVGGVALLTTRRSDRCAGKLQ